MMVKSGNLIVDTRYIARLAEPPLNTSSGPGHYVMTCVAGAGASITAIKNGKTLDTSMGMTPLEG